MWETGMWHSLNINFIDFKANESAEAEWNVVAVWNILPPSVNLHALCGLIPKPIVPLRASQLHENSL